MNETWLKIKGMLGDSAVKALAVLVLIAGGVFFIIAVSSLYTAITNPNEPQAAAISQLVDGTIGANRYIQISGYADHDVGYTQTEDGKAKATYYAMLDMDSGHLVIVEADTPTVSGRRDGAVTISGMTHSTPGELKELIESDLPAMEKAGFKASAKIYLSEGQKPASVIGALFFVFVLGAICLLSLVPLFFPGVVFAPAPLPLDVPQPAQKGNPGMRATGRFLRLQKVQPEIVIGRGARNFEKAVANLVPRAERDLMIYIHHIQRTKTYGVTVHKSETDWGVFINQGTLMSIESGKLYGWKNRRAVRFYYQGKNGKQERLILSFEYDWAHADAVALLQKMGFPVNQ